MFPVEDNVDFGAMFLEFGFRLTAFKLCGLKESTVSLGLLSAHL